MKLSELQREFESAVAEDAKESDLTQTELAKRCGWHQAHLSLWLSGKAPIPAKHLEKLAEVVGVKIVDAKVVREGGPQ